MLSPDIWPTQCSNQVILDHNYNTPTHCTLKMTFFSLSAISVSLTTSAFWLGSIVVAQVTPVLLASSLQTSGTFYLLVGVQIAGLLLVLLALPETKVVECLLKIVGSVCGIVERETESTKKNLDWNPRPITKALNFRTLCNFSMDSISFSWH